MEYAAEEGARSNVSNSTVASQGEGTHSKEGAKTRDCANLNWMGEGGKVQTP